MIMALAGIGVGPANLSLASLLVPTGLSNMFFERRPTFDWHGGMDVERATLQVSFLKDLVTLSDPTNPYSFLSYLHESGRIYHFLNARFDAVTRREFSGYFAWACARNKNIHMGEEVRDISFDGVFRIVTSDRTILAYNIALGLGQSPRVPETARDKIGPSQFHSSEFLTRAASLAGKHVTVVGGGQSGAEIFLELLSRPDGQAPHHVSWITRRRCFWPIDDSAFTNDLYMPCFQDYFASLGKDDRKQFLDDHVLTSDGISGETLKQIYQVLYTKRFIEGCLDFATLLPNREVGNVVGDAGRWSLQVRHQDHDEAELLRTDVVIWATGYEGQKFELLNNLAGRLHWTEGEVRVDDNYAAAWDGPRDRAIFIQNGARLQKGLADPNLSLLAWRSERIIERLTGTRSKRRQIASMMSWAPMPVAERRRIA